MGTEKGEGAHLRRPSRDAVRRLLRLHGLSADKRLGQHFLTDGSVVDAILSRVEGAHGALEVGPGIGVLTAPLCELCEEVVAVELDRRFVEILAEVAPRARVVQADVLKTDVAELLGGLPGPRCIVSNMPYNITGPLLAKVSECRGLFRNAVLMMQREVGERVVAEPGTPARGALSVSMQLQYQIVKVCEAKAGAFLPPPKVDSVVLDFVPRKDRASLDKVLEVVKRGFAQPRKTLANNLAQHYERDKIALPVNVRPHQLTNEQWVELSTRL